MTTTSITNAITNAPKRRCHYTRLGIRIQPRCADGEGYLQYREGFQKTPREKWTHAERLIDGMEQSLREFQRL